MSGEQKLFVEDGWVWMSGSLFQKTKMDRWSLGLEHDLGYNLHPEIPTVALVFIFLIQPLTLFSVCLLFSVFHSWPFLCTAFFLTTMPLISYYLTCFFKLQVQREVLCIHIEVLLDFKGPNGRTLQPGLAVEPHPALCLTQSWQILGSTW